MSREEMLKGLFAVKMQYGVPEAKKIIVEFGRAEKANGIPDDKIEAVLLECKARLGGWIPKLPEVGPNVTPMPPIPTGSMPPAPSPEDMQTMMAHMRENALIASMRKRGNELLPINYSLGAMMISCAYHLEQLMMKEQSK